MGQVHYFPSLALSAYSRYRKVGQFGAVSLRVSTVVDKRLLFVAVQQDCVSDQLLAKIRDSPNRLVNPPGLSLNFWQTEAG